MHTMYPGYNIFVHIPPSKLKSAHSCLMWLPLTYNTTAKILVYTLVFSQLLDLFQSQVVIKKIENQIICAQFPRIDFSTKLVLRKHISYFVSKDCVKSHQQMKKMTIGLTCTLSGSTAHQKYIFYAWLCCPYRQKLMHFRPLHRPSNQIGRRTKVYF